MEPLLMSIESPWNSVVYAEVHAMAQALMAQERRDHTLEPTALAHEVWLRLSKSRNAAELAPGALIGLAAQAMRRVLTDHARARAASKRGGGARRTTLEGKSIEWRAESFALDLDEVLGELEGIDPQLARLVELRFYAGCSTDQIAEALEMSERTVKRRWRFARAWLQKRLEEEQP